MIRAAIIACFVLAGCAGKMINEKMAGMVGQPLDAAVAKLGMPTEERTIAGHKVYIWLTRSVTEGTERKCQVRAVMTGDTISAFDFEGTEFACLQYANMLNR